MTPSSRPAACQMKSVGRAQFFIRVETLPSHGCISFPPRHGYVCVAIASRHIFEHGQGVPATVASSHRYSHLYTCTVANEATVHAGAVGASLSVACDLVFSPSLGTC